MLSTVTSVHDLRVALMPWREKGESVAFVPTMGALHRGHMTLIAEARKMARRVVVSIFVNPKQFAANEDLSKYPHKLAEDSQMLAEAGVDLLYAPLVDEMYPAGYGTTVEPGPVATVLEGAFRPSHFRGVVTVVTKLLLQIFPDAALFGEKDYQQLQVIRQTVRDLNIPIHIVSVPIVRDPDGLALSSRNVYLSAKERENALALPRALKAVAEAIKAGGVIEYELTQGRNQLSAAGFSVDYFELTDARSLQPVRDLSAPARLLAAGFIGSTRLIDNISI